MATTLTWRGADDVAQNMGQYASQVQDTLLQIGQSLAPVMEAAMKQNAPWVDRSGAARSGLNAYAEPIDGGRVHIVLAHRMEYGLFLEVRWNGRYAILWPTVEAHLGDIEKMLQEVFRR